MRTVLGITKGIGPLNRPIASIEFGFRWNRCSVARARVGAPVYDRCSLALDASRLPSHGAGTCMAASSGNVEEQRWWHVSRDVFVGLYHVVRKNLASLAFVFLATESINFVLNRVFHRLTNEAAMAVLGCSPDMIGNLWWLSQNPNLGNAYQLLTGLVFVLAFPCSVLVKTIQSVYFFFISSEVTSEVSEEVDPGVMSGIKAGIERARSMWPRVKEIVPGVVAVEFLVSLVVVPLQFVSLLVFTLPFTLPIIMSVHVALPVALAEHLRGWDAVKRSRELMKPIQWGASIPFVCIIICQRFIQISKEKLVAILPVRFYYELLEIPLAILALGFAASVMASLARQSLPVVCYSIVTKE